jgi:hypothetical protein
MVFVLATPSFIKHVSSCFWWSVMSENVAAIYQDVKFKTFG